MSESIWPTKKLADLSTKPISYGIVQTGDSIENDGIPCVRVIDLTSRIIDISQMITTTEEISNSYKRTILEKDELMIALRGEIGLVRLASSELVGCNLTRGIARIAPNRQKVHPKYLLWALRSYHVRNDLLKRVNGSALQEIPIKELRKIAVPIPDLGEQKRIVEILEVWESAIALTEQLITAKQKLKNNLLNKMLEDAFTLPETEKTRLRDIASVKTGPFGSLLHESDYVNIGTPIITVEHLSEHGILHKGLPLVSDEDKARLKSYFLKEGDIVFSRVGSVDRSSVISHSEDGWLFSGRLLRVRPNKQKVCHQYLNYYFHQPRFRHTIRSMAVGGTMPCLNTQILGSIQLLLPPIQVQRKIAEILRSCDLDIQNHVDLLSHYKKQKKGLMQKLLTGEWRVPVEEIAA